MAAAMSEVEETAKMVEQWQKPGPGSWELDTAHFSPDCSRVVRDAIVDCVPRGTAAGLAFMGGPIKQMDAEFVNGRFYRRLVPLVSGGSDRPPPPDVVLKIVTRLHPAFRKAERQAGTALAERVWLRELEQWEQKWKPELIRSSTRFSKIDVAALDDGALADHLDELLAFMADGLELHFRLHASDLGPIGLLLLETRALGKDDREVMATLAGGSPATSAPGDVLAMIRARVDEAGTTPSTLAQLRALSPEIDTAVEEFLEVYGWRITTGYDLRDETLAELPEVVFRSIMHARMVEDAGAPSTEPLLGGLPADQQARIEALIDDARLLYGLRDENGPLTYEWPAGLARRAVLEVGRRLDVAGMLPADGRRRSDLNNADVNSADVNSADVNDAVFDLTGAEMSALLRCEAGPLPDEIADRLAERRGWLRLEQAPVWLGPALENPSTDVFPQHTRQLMDVILTVLELLEFEREPRAEQLCGVGIGEEVYVGRACVVTDASDALSAMEPGDVLVAPFTVPTFNSVLAMAGAVVVDSGGLLCHAAVIAREYGIAGVVGVGEGTTLIPNGAMIEVDPVAGRVRVLD